MKWRDILEECWELLEIKLKNKKIDNIASLMDYIF